MSDFFTWFLYKHFLIAGMIFPELAFVFAVYQRWTFSAVVLAMFICFKFGFKIFATIAPRPL